MMSTLLFGFLLGIGATFVWSIVNFIDKYFVEKYCKDTGPGALIVLSSLFTVTLLPIAYFFSDSTLFISPKSILVLLVSGVLTTTWITLYLYALQDDDVSVVMPIFQLTPLFTLFFGFLFLRELPTAFQLIACALILAGSIMLSYEPDTRKIKIKLLLYIASASLAIALMNSLFKFAAVDEAFWVSIFWFASGTFCTGIILYLCNTQYRTEFRSFIKQNYGIGLSLNVVNESLTLIGDVLFAYAILLAPLVLVQTTEAFQPLFALLFGFIITWYAPQFLSEKIDRATMLRKVVAIILITAGAVWIAIG